MQNPQYTHEHTCNTTKSFGACNHLASRLMAGLLNWHALRGCASVLLMCSLSVSSYAAILTDSSEQRIQIRYGTNPSKDVSNGYSYLSNVYPSTVYQSTTSNASTRQITGDSMQGLIEQKQRQAGLDSRLSIEESQRINRAQPLTRYNTTYINEYPTATNTYAGFGVTDFSTWLNSDLYRRQQVADYQRYLSAQLGAQNVPPMSQLLTTARSWDKCGYEPYQLPPRELWSNMVPTLRLYSELKSQGILPPTSEIRSVYRSPGLNDCAGGADSSKHMSASAMDIWVPEYDDNQWQLSRMQDGLCQFWQYQGGMHNFGLGLYSTGAIHLDTDGYRKWGFTHASSSSSCRY